MAWNFDTFAEWRDAVGRQWKVIVAAGVIAAGSTVPLWYDRPQPKYPKAIDEATLLSALLERKMVSEYAFSIYVGQPAYTLSRTLDGTNGTRDNAVLYYPSGSVVETCSAKTAYLLKNYRWVQMLPGCAWENDLSLFADDGISWAHFYSNTVDLAFFQDNLNGIVFDYGPLPDRKTWDFSWRTNYTASYYVATNAYNQIGRALSVMRHTVNNNPQIGASGYVGTWIKHGVASDCATMEEAYAAAVANCAAASETYDQLYWTADYVYEGASIQVSRDSSSPNKYRASIYSFVNDLRFTFYDNNRTDSTDRVFITVQAQQISSIGVFATNPYAFYMPPPAIADTNKPLLMAVTNTMSLPLATGSGPTRRTYIRPKPAHDFDIGYPETPPIGQWRNRGKGWRLDGVAITAEHNFLFLTNAAAFW